MSVQVANASLSAAVLGTTGKISFGKALPPATLSQQMRPQDATGGATLLVWNESGCGLTCRFPITGKSFTIPAGGWRQLMVPPSEVELDYTVSYVLPNAPVTQLLADLYLPGEAVDAGSVLGNSPIGLAGSVPTSVTQVINDVNPSVQAVLEATPTTGVNAGISSAQINNDGGGYLGGNKLKFDNAGNLTLDNATVNTPAYFLKDSVNNDEIEMVMIGEVFNMLASYRGGAFAAVLQLALSTSMLYVPGGFAKIGNQATAGNFGAPVIVAQALGVSVAVTTLQTILTYAVPATGYYRINGNVYINNGTPGQPTLAQVTYTDPDGTTFPVFMSSAGDLVTVSAGVLTAKAYGPSTSVDGNMPLQSILIHAQSGHNIVCQYQDNGGTPNDKVSFIIERLA